MGIDNGKFHCVVVTTVTTEKFNSIYNAEVRLNNIKENNKEGVTAELVPMKTRKVF